MPEQGFFFDSSGIVKRYANEIGTDWVRSITTLDADNSIVISKITAVEVAAALARKLRLEEKCRFLALNCDKNCQGYHLRALQTSIWLNSPLAYFRNSRSCLYNEKPFRRISLNQRGS